MAERFPGPPLSRKSVLMPFDDAARRADEQGKVHVGGGIGQHAGRIAHANAALGACRDVDVVEADREVADDLEPRYTFQEWTVDRVGQQRHDAVAVRRFAAQDSRGRRQLIRPDFRIARFVDQLQAGIGYAARDEYSRLDWHGRLLVGPKRLGSASMIPAGSAAETVLFKKNALANVGRSLCSRRK